MRVCDLIYVSKITLAAYGEWTEGGNGASMEESFLHDVERNGDS